MHAGAVDGESAFAAQRVIDGKDDGAGGTQDAHDEQGEAAVEKIVVPGSVGEEPMEACPMAVGNIAAGKDDIGDIAMAMGKDPTGADLHEGAESGLGESRTEMN